jgi:hypothetical protein
MSRYSTPHSLSVSALLVALEPDYGAIHHIPSYHTIPTSRSPPGTEGAPQVAGRAVRHGGRRNRAGHPAWARGPRRHHPRHHGRPARHPGAPVKVLLAVLPDTQGVAHVLMHSFRHRFVIRLLPILNTVPLKPDAVAACVKADILPHFAPAPSNPDANQQPTTVCCARPSFNCPHCDSLRTICRCHYAVFGGVQSAAQQQAGPP